MEGRRLAAQGMRSCRPRRRARCNSTILAQGQPDLDVARRLADGEPDALETLHRATVPRLRIVKLHVTTPRPRTMSRSAVTRRGASVHVRRRGSASCAASVASACVTGSRRSARGSRRASAPRRAAGRPSTSRQAPCGSMASGLRARLDDNRYGDRFRRQWALPRYAPACSMHAPCCRGTYPARADPSLHLDTERTSYTH